MILARGAELVRLGVLALRRQRSQVRILSGAPKSLPLQNKSGHQWRGLPLRKAHRKPAPISAVGDDRPDYPREKFRSAPQVALVSTGCAIHRYPRGALRCICLLTPNFIRSCLDPLSLVV